MNDERVSNKILVIAICPIYLCIAFFTLFVIGLASVNASFEYAVALDNLTNSELSSWSSNKENTVGFTYINAKEQGQIRLMFMDNDWINESAQSNDYVFVVEFGGRGTPVNQLSISSYSASFSSFIKSYSLEKINSRRCFSYGPVDCTSSYRLIVHFYYNSSDVSANLYFKFNTFDTNDYWLGFYDHAKNVNINLYTEKEYQEIKRQEETNNKLDGINQSQNQTNEKLDEMLGGELDDTSSVDSSGLDGYESASNGLINKDNLGKIDSLSVAIDSKSNKYVWDIVTKFIQSHTLVFSLVITMLSIGIIKLVLNR